MRPQSPASGIGAKQVDSFRPSVAAQKLVAGSVAQPVNFDAAAQAGVARGLQMYTRAADRVEAAVRIELGRAIDLKG